MQIKGELRCELGKNSALARQTWDWANGASHKEQRVGRTGAALGNKHKVAIGLGHWFRAAGLSRPHKQVEMGLRLDKVRPACHSAWKHP